MTNTHSAVPILEAPGNGLPPAEAFISRHLLFPTLTTFLSAEKAIQLLISNGKESLNLAKPLAEEKLTQKILINRFRGIEDSSRHWSVLMTISHLLITGEGVASNTEQLARGEKVDRVVRIE
ncbi:MAG: hypothetical protein KTR14_07960, partial [Vampirovibrio sp.]|nr:hypothetical protein [Vampirovibrio sp.]